MVSASKSFPQSSSTYDAATGITYVSQYDVFTIGAGYLDLQNALSEAFNPPPANSSMNSPLASYDTSSGNVYFGSDQHALWGSSSIWDKLERVRRNTVDIVGQSCTVGRGFER